MKTIYVVRTRLDPQRIFAAFNSESDARESMEISTQRLPLAQAEQSMAELEIVPVMLYDSPDHL
jgi:hypothetical protein